MTKLLLLGATVVAAAALSAASINAAHADQKHQEKQQQAPKQEQRPAAEPDRSAPPAERQSSPTPTPATHYDPTDETGVWVDHSQKTASPPPARTDDGHEQAKPDAAHGGFPGGGARGPGGFSPRPPVDSRPPVIDHPPVINHPPFDPHPPRPEPIDPVHGGSGKGPGGSPDPGKGPGHNPTPPPTPAPGPGQGKGPGKPVVGPGGPIVQHPGGPSKGVSVGGKTPPTVFRGGAPHQPFAPVHVVPGQLEPVRSPQPYPGRWHPLPHYGYCNGYYWNSVRYVGPFPYFFGYDAWGPTEWIFVYDTGMWWSPATGFIVAPPVFLNEPITVAVNEQQPVLDAFGNQEYDLNGDPVFDTVTVYYNAYFDPVYGAYGYLNSAGDYVWLQW